MLPPGDNEVGVKDETLVSEEEEFGAAFDEANSVSTESADKDVGADDGDVDDNSVEGSADQDDGDSDGGDDASGDDGVDGDDVGTDSSDNAVSEADEPAPSAEVSAREKELLAEIEKLKSAQAQAPAPAPAPAPAQSQEQAQEPQQDKPVVSEEDEAKIKAYKEEWGDVAEAEALIRRQENHVIVKYIFDQVQAAIAPLVKYHESRSGRDQYEELVDLVSDYDEVRDKAVDWVNGLPEGALKRAYVEITNTGTAEEVAELIETFKSRSGYESASKDSPSQSPSSAGQTAASKPEAKSANAKKAGASLRVVKSGRTKTTTAGPDINDFDAAFDEFAQKK
jgi:hypothetical protein